MTHRKHRVDPHELNQMQSTILVHPLSLVFPLLSLVFPLLSLVFPLSLLYLPSLVFLALLTPP
jgi:hypothetical protein